MIDWSEYLKSLSKSKTVMDSMTLSYNGRIMHISPIVKASILMLEDMISKQGNHNIFVFPEISQFSKEFLLGKVIYNITAGKIEMSYDPNKFTKGQILKYKNCAVEFDHMEEVNNSKLIFVKFKDGMLYGLPVGIAPYFQISDTKKLCTYKSFAGKYSEEEAFKFQNDPNHTVDLLDTLENYKTHLNGSIFYVSSIKNSKEFLTLAELDNKKITDILYMAQANYEGILSNLSAGQLSGNPAIILATDLYAVKSAIDNGVVPQSIIFDASQPNSIDKQLDAFDELAKLKIPIVCITNTANSFDLSNLLERHYNLWRWDSSSIAETIITNENSIANKCVKNCLNHSVEYLYVSDENISESVKTLYKHKSEIDEQPPLIVSAYEKLFSLAFTILRTVIPFESEDIKSYCNIIASCITNIDNSKHFISKELYSDLSSTALALLSVFEKAYQNPKFDAICKLIQDNHYNSVCIIVPENLDRSKHQKYWESNAINCNIKVMYPIEYQERPELSFDIVIISGWLGNTIMRKIIYGFSSKKYLVLTYLCEEKWKKAHTRVWKKSLNNCENSEMVKKAFSTKKRPISYTPTEYFDETSIVPVEDEFVEIENVIRTSKYRQYSNGTKASDIVNAYPISFVGGFLAFYREGHKALVATDIIVNNGDRIINKLPEKLEVGDFVIIRESEHDLIKDLADKILEKSGELELRKISAKWKESLSVESLFSTPEEIFENLKYYGCTKGFLTVKNWMTNDDVIQPNDKDDLLCIAKATGDDVLKEKIDIIFDAGREVRNAHISAGRLLSQRLKNKIAEDIHSLGEIDTFNVWDPITLQLEDIGQVKILKVIDINSAVPVDSGNTNRLLNE